MATAGGGERIGILIQARMSSRRLPGKVLRPLAGRPLLAYVVERCRQVRGADMVAVLTSAETADDAIADWGRETGTTVFRGPLDDVAGRFLEAAESYDLAGFVRVNADSPFLDQRLVERGLELYGSADADLATNVLRRSYPVGMSVEVLNRRRYREAYAEMTTDDEREHVTRHYYMRPERFRIASFSAERDLGDRSLAVDTPADLARAERIAAAMQRPHWEYDCAAVCGLAESLGALATRDGVAP